MLRALVLVLFTFTVNLSWADQASFEQKANRALQQAFRRNPNQTQTVIVQMDAAEEQTSLEDNFATVSRTVCQILLDSSSSLSLHMLIETENGGGLLVIEANQAALLKFSEHSLVTKLTMSASRSFSTTKK